MPICPKCGYSCRPGWPECPACGASLKSLSVPAPSVTPAAPQSNKPVNKPAEEKKIELKPLEEKKE